MNKKKMRPLSTETSKKKSVSDAKPRSKWWFGILLIGLLVVYLIWKNTVSQSNQTAVENLPIASEQNEPTQSASEPLEETMSEVAIDDARDSANITDSDIPDPKAILNAPLPETDSLAKEEIDRLEDERKRLAEQEKLAAEQVAMAKQLTELKAEEIELLEQQIAQLEANQGARATTE